MKDKVIVLVIIKFLFISCVDLHKDKNYKKYIQYFEQQQKGSTSHFPREYKSVINDYSYNIALFAEQNRAMIEYAPGGAGDWKAEGKPGSGYTLVDVGGKPYWADAIGQIPFAVDHFTDVLESTGNIKIARERTIERGKTFGDGWGISSDNSNSYDNAMIKRAINWAEKRYKVIKGSGWFGDTYDLQKTNHSPDNLSKSSNEKQ